MQKKRKRVILVVQYTMKMLRLKLETTASFEAVLDLRNASLGCQVQTGEVLILAGKSYLNSGTLI